MPCTFFPALAVAALREPQSMTSLFQSTGIVGPLMLLAGAITFVVAVRRWLELRPSRLAPESLQRSLELKLHDGQHGAALQAALESKTLLGELVAAGLRLRAGGLDEMLANIERATGKESLRHGNRVANLSRWGGAVLLIGLWGTTAGLISTMAVLSRLKDPTTSDFVTGIGESLVCVAVALLVALFCFGAFFLMDSKLTRQLLAVREIAEEMAREAVESAPRAG